MSMSELQQNRKLAAILAADVAGYSRLMGQDESDTVRALTESREVFVEHIARHRGHVVDTAGDSVLATFDSPVEAVGCAVEIQAELARRNRRLAEDRRMHFRIGINLGDVIVREDNTVYGDGVNIAARLESLAQPGGITVSGTAFDHAENKLPVAFEFTGEQAVKNIAKPARAYRVVTESASGASPSADKPLTLPDKPSIAVLAFNNLSGDSDQDYFADGIAEDLITSLSQIRWMFVTARNSSFAYKGQSPDVRQVGKELGVRYVLEGSVRKGGNRVRISAQLIEAASGNHVWAQRYDRDLVDLFDLQDEITETLVAALQGEVGEFERERAHRKPPDNLDAWESYQRGMWHLWRMNNAEDLAEARRMFQRAADLDPNFAQPVAAMSYSLFLQIMFTYAESPLEMVEQASQFANKAIALDDKEAMAHFALGRIQTLRGEYDAAIEELRTAIDLNPSLALAHYGLGHAFALARQLEEAISKCDTAIRLSPRDLLIWSFYSHRAWVRIAMRDYEAAVEDARRAIRHRAAAFHNHATLASALALLDRREEAKIALDKLLEIAPDFNVDAMLATFSPLNPEALRPLYKTYVDGLRKAGLDISDEPTAAD
jgi:adenylate cyclase